jgi:hypothetical protein
MIVATHWRFPIKYLDSQRNQCIHLLMMHLTTTISVCLVGEPQEQGNADQLQRLFG